MGTCKDCKYWNSEFLESEFGYCEVDRVISNPILTNDYYFTPKKL